MKCENCGQDNPLEARFCAHCGAKLVADVEVPSPAAAPSPLQVPRKWLLIGGIIAVLAIAGIIIGFALLSDGSETTLQTTTMPTTTSMTTTTSLEGSQVGNLAPDFQLKDLDGNTVSLSGFKGNPVVLNFWRST